MRRDLQPHPDFPCDTASGLAVDVERAPSGRLALRYSLAADVERLWLPDVTSAERTDELWRRTCFEVFVAAPDGGYVEVNLAPTGQWAAYRFDGYREGMRVAEAIGSPRLEAFRTAATYELAATLDLSSLPLDAPWRLAVSAVLEDAAGAKSYWALAHPPGKPDFHSRASFVLELPAPGTP